MKKFFKFMIIVVIAFIAVIGLLIVIGLLSDGENNESRNEPPRISASVYKNMLADACYVSIKENDITSNSNDFKKSKGSLCSCFGMKMVDLDREIESLGLVGKMTDAEKLKAGGNKLALCAEREGINLNKPSSEVFRIIRDNVPNY